MSNFRWDNPPYYLSAYALACKRGFVGTLDDWLASLKGEPGDRGKSAYEYAVEAGFDGSEDLFREMQLGNGKTAYEYAVEGGFKGTSEEFAKKMAELPLKFVVGDTAPECGPVLWFNTAPESSNSAAVLILSDDASGYVVQAEVDGKNYGVENATVNQSPTEKTYDFTVL